MSVATDRHKTLPVVLARAGFADTGAVEQLLHADHFRGILDPADDMFDDGLVSALSRVADPDAALHALSDLLVAGARDPQTTNLADLRALLRTPSLHRDQLLAVQGGSVALAASLVRHPQSWAVLGGVTLPGAEQLRRDLLVAVRADPDADRPVSGLPTREAHDALRVAYRRIMVQVAGFDLVAADPIEVLPEVARALADAASGALTAALAIARREVPQSQACRLAIIGMGKCGGRELNYVSDVDVIFVAEPAPDADEATALLVGTKLAAALTRACSAATAEGTLWPVDAALRPEGKDGPLVRTVASHQAYYERWAHTWEFQALLKARLVAGDADLGQRYTEAISPMVWVAADRENFVPEVQAMRRRVQDHIPATVVDRQLKLGAGGLRDVEFSVQLLQLVHGRFDRELRSFTTLTALSDLAEGGYVGRADAAELDHAYRFLRALEHRVQVYRMTRTHVIPEDPDQLRLLGRAMGYTRDPAAEVIAAWRAQAQVVRGLHEKLFYRPVLLAASQIRSTEGQLSEQAAGQRLQALGYRDPARALRHIAALTSGVSRRAAIQRQLLPVLLGWFAQGADADAGLLAFRQLSDDLGTTHWYLQMLRDSGVAAQRMAQVLSSSTYVVNLLRQQSQVVALFGTDTWQIPESDQLQQAAQHAVGRHPDDVGAAVRAIRAQRAAQVTRLAIGEVSGLHDVTEVAAGLSNVTNATINATVQAVLRAEGEIEPLPMRLLVVAMGRLGGGENGYTSDADVLFAYEPVGNVTDQQAHECAQRVVGAVRTLLAAPGSDGALQLDADLRPEGRNGPLVRSLESYRQYYDRWSLIWEAQALLRAVPIVGDADLAEQFTAIIDPVRCPASGISATDLREIRRLKARMESERLPRGVDPSGHLKLGPGGLSDVEWTVQVWQLQHGHRIAGLRTASTLAALAAAQDAEVVSSADAHVLRSAWLLAMRLRHANVLWSGRGNDTVPHAATDLDGVARLLGYPPASGAKMREDYRRATRRCRAVVQRLFYGE